jgi:poly(3-hydroxyoctanoate) depolymerase
LRVTFLSLFGCAAIEVDDGPSRCVTTDERIACESLTDTFSDGVGPRDVVWQVPLGDPPDEGWPVALFFQGAFFSPETIFAADRGAAFGAVHQVGVTKALLDAGFAVIAPEAMGDGLTCWNTNVPPWADDWDSAPDDALMTALFAAIDDGTLAPLDGDRLFALGISSGGYMTSRMALAYPGRFDALVIVSASWATCAGWACALPASLPEDHPPTRFLHGRLDPVVPIATMEPYEARLAGMGVSTDVRVDEWRGHGWSESAPEAVLDWFER